jgi:hypothetical protein
MVIFASAARPSVCLFVCLDRIWSISYRGVVEGWRDDERNWHGELLQYYRDIAGALPWTNFVSWGKYIRGTMLRKAWFVLG